MTKISLLLAGLVAVPMLAQANVIDFDDLVLPNYGTIPADYMSRSGDTPNVTVSYETVGLSSNIEFWSTGYGDLSNVGYADASGYLARISLTPDPGYAVSLLSFDMAGYPNTTQPNQTVRILDGNGSVVVDYSPWNITGSGHDHFTPNLTSSGTLTIEWGTSWNGAIDNIAFRQSVVGVPDSGSTLLLALGGCLGVLACSRRK